MKSMYSSNLSPRSPGPLIGGEGKGEEWFPSSFYGLSLDVEELQVSSTLSLLPSSHSPLRAVVLLLPSSSAPEESLESRSTRPRYT